MYDSTVRILVLGTTHAASTVLHASSERFRLWRSNVFSHRGTQSLESACDTKLSGPELDNYLMNSLASLTANLTYLLAKLDHVSFRPRKCQVRSSQPQTFPRSVLEQELGCVSTCRKALEVLQLSKHLIRLASSFLLFLFSHVLARVLHESLVARQNDILMYQQQSLRISERAYIWFFNELMMFDSSRKESRIRLGPECNARLIQESGEPGLMIIG